MKNVTYKHDMFEHGGVITHVVKARKDGKIITEQRGRTYYEAVKKLARVIERITES